MARFMEALFLQLEYLAMWVPALGARATQRQWLRLRGAHGGAFHPRAPAMCHGWTPKTTRSPDRRHASMPLRAEVERSNGVVLEDSSWEVEPESGPAFEATLRMLDWASLAAQARQLGGLAGRAEAHPLANVTAAENRVP